MDFTKIIVVSGKSGAFKVIAQSRSGFIVESLIDGKKMPVSAANRITSVEDIVVFTDTEEVKLKDIFKKMKEITNGEKGVDHKADDQQIKEFFEKALPDYDRERVYLSDMKKMIFWYNLLQQNNMLDFEEEKEVVENAEENEVVAEEKKAEPKAEKVAAKSPAKKKTPSEEKPVKKAAVKKTDKKKE